MTAKRMTKAELRARFPHPLGVRGLGELDALDYVSAADHGTGRTGTRRRLEGADRVAYFELAIERHTKAIERQEKQNLRWYGTTANVGRNRVLQNTVRRQNRRVVAELSNLVDQLKRDEGARRAALAGAKSRLGIAS
jgi:hypothetical protein